MEIKAPAFPESITEGTVAQWHKQTGEAVRRDERRVTPFRERKRRGERRVRSGEGIVVAGQVEPESGEALPERRRRSQLRDPGETLTHVASASVQQVRRYARSCSSFASNGTSSNARNSIT